MQTPVHRKKSLWQSREWLRIALLLLLGFLTQPSYADTISAYDLQPGDRLAHALGWTRAPKANLCDGYYQDPQLAWEPPGEIVDPTTTPVEITANKWFFEQDGVSRVSGHVIIRQPGEKMSADEASFVRNAKTKEIISVDLNGHVVARKPGNMVKGNRAHMVLQDQTGYFQDALYRYTLDPQVAIGPKLEHGLHRVTGLTAHGHADLIEQLKRNNYALQTATYTTCSPYNQVWHLKARRIELNHDTGRGVARHASLWVGDIPVLYTPYLNFPIDRRRQSGFLFPIYGHDTLGGYRLGLPYYWNIAPNYDATFTPEYYSVRGIQMNALFRYLTKNSIGDASAAYLPNDRAFAQLQQNYAATYAGNVDLPILLNSSTNRYYYLLQDTSQFSPNLSASISYTSASDDYYFQDFGSVPTISTANQLLHQAALTYNTDNWTFLFNVQGYQTLHPVNQGITQNQYSRLPQLGLFGSMPHQFLGLTYLFQGEMVHYVSSANPGEVGEPPAGNRFHAVPGLSLPLLKSWGYFTPTAQFDLTEYNINNQPYSYPRQINRTLPIVSVDSGLYFDRSLHFLSREYTQTLEPRVFYLNVPYRYQTDIPVFDTELQAFSFDQLFRTNRFTGIDRISNANQVSVALTSRLLDPETGTEKWRFGIGRIYYFQNREVMLCGTPGCLDPEYAVGTTSPVEKASPLVALLSYNINNGWNMTGNWAYDPDSRATVNANANLQYQPLPNHLFNLGYNFVQFGDSLVNYNPTISPNNPQNNLSQASASLAWPLFQHWQAVGSWTYNFSHEYGQNYFYGAQYDSCCWAVQMVIGRTFTGVASNGIPQFSRQVYLQLILKGLGNIGTGGNLAAALSSAVPGYHPPTAGQTLF